VFKVIRTWEQKALHQIQNHVAEAADPPSYS